jgi:prophage DNA circulation protein
LSAIQSRLGDLARRTALQQIARLSAVYQPASQNDAQAKRAAIVALFDAEMHVAADQGEDGAFTALSDLREAVIADLTARGASLAPIAFYELSSPLPSDVVALRLYRDAGRGDELIDEVSPVHPLFMPRVFSALAN